MGLLTIAFGLLILVDGSRDEAVHALPFGFDGSSKLVDTTLLLDDTLLVGSGGLIAGFVELQARRSRARLQLLKLACERSGPQAHSSTELSSNGVGEFGQRRGGHAHPPGVVDRVGDQRRDLIGRCRVGRRLSDVAPSLVELPVNGVQRREGNQARVEQPR